ncbi:MAG: 3-octaprenyl-4-hydroxybenzoate carboxy-lyase [Syntrophorhabdus sp. PtaU1.Bin050]|nr:MAG: 3-octaprenyl-4-hydroxybenzoate carboxy-lyase [Syntrophorhabdus sp. PtaU1.Bin050]
MSKFPYRDLREWFAFLDEQGDLVHVKKEIDMKGEVAAISRKIAQVDGAAVVFENIKGYPNWRLYSDGLTTRRRIAWALGMDSASPGDIRQSLIERLKGKPTTPKEVATGPCKEIKLFGDEIDLMDIPTAFSGELELTPHLTAGLSFVQDPDTGWTNVGIRRFQIVDRDKLLELILPTQHEGLIFGKYKRMRKPMPIAIAIGVDPVACMVSNLPAPPEVNELDYWGLFTGTSLETVKCETNGMYVPATSEIVIEGMVSPDEVALEGPFPEFNAYYSGFRMCPVIKIEAITMRNEPISQFMLMSTMPCEGQNITQLLNELELYRQFKDLVPGVKDVAVISVARFTLAVSLDKEVRRRMPGLEKRLAMAIKATSPSVKTLFIVDDDVDPHNFHEILWALSVRFQPSKNFTVIDETTGHLLDPSTTLIGPGYGYTGLGSFGIIDCTEKLPPYDEGYKRGVALPPQEAIRTIEENWVKYGFKEV